MIKILLLEDDLSLIDGLSYSLKKQGFETDIAQTLREAESFFATGKYSLLLLDVSLPDGSGFDFCKKIRHQSDIPVIFLTASDEEVNIIMGLDIGGDDYITKPFKLGVLVSKINALLRRTKGTNNTVIASNGITVYQLRGEVYKGGTAIDLTAAEYRLLCLFMHNPGIILEKETILDKLWDSNGSYVDGNTLAVYIRRLRTKLENDPGSPRMLVTVRGLGYKWDVTGQGGNV